MTIARGWIVALFVLMSAFGLVIPIVADASGLQADQQCIPSIPPCPCGTIMGQQGCQPGNNKYLCPCIDTTNGFPTAGQCQATMRCKAQTAGGQGVDSGLSQLGQALGQLLQKLGGGGGGGGSPPATVPTPTGCLGTPYQTSDVTQLTDPCATYVAPPVTIPTTTPLTIGSSTCDTLSQELGQCGTPTPTPTTSPDTVTQNSNTNTNDNQSGGQLTSIISASSSLNLAGLGAPSSLAPNLGPSGPFGNITYSLNGATIFGQAFDAGSNTGVSSFYGSDSGTFQQSNGFAAQLCESRPWAGSGFIASLLPDAFFDSLCASHGYQVGPPPVATSTPQVQLQQSPPVPQTSTQPATTTQFVIPDVPPKVQIWATPASVSLDTRTTVFWTTQGVGNCTESSSDGNFSASTLSGGAQTVPITEATTFNISCSDKDGNPVEDSVTVNLSI